MEILKAIAENNSPNDRAKIILTKVNKFDYLKFFLFKQYRKKN